MVSRKSLGNGAGRDGCGGDYAPVVGRALDMDMCMVDGPICRMFVPATKQSDKPQTLERKLKTMKTIPYEALTGISHRVKRIYQEE